MEDPVFHKIPADSRAKLVDYAMNIGKQIAKETVKEFGTRNPITIAERLGVRIIYDSSSPFYSFPSSRIFHAYHIHSEYQANSKTIRVFTSSTSYLRKLITKRGLQQLFPVDHIVEYCVAHELFHFIEHTRTGQVSKHFMVDTFKLGPIRIRSRVASLSEIAAHAFTQTLLNLKRSTKILDYIITNKQLYRPDE